MAKETENNNVTSLNDCLMSDLVPVSKWNDYFSYPTNGALRQLIFYAERYNFKNVVKKLGNRLYISISAFNKWVEEQNKEAAI